MAITQEVAIVNVGSYDTDFEYFTFSPANVEVSYAPYGEQEFSVIEVAEDPEKFFMPGFGAYYEGSLGCVDRTSANGWYDLKVVMTDAAGNTQSQVILPAFHIDGCVGVSTIDAAKTMFSVEGGKIISTDGSEPEVYDLVGCRVANDNLSCGIYVVRSKSRVAKLQVNN